MKTLFKNAIILQLDLPKGYFKGDVVVEDDKIIFVDKRYNGSYDKKINVNGNILSPGFINTHTHSPMSILRSVKDEVNLQSWLFDNIFPMEQQLTYDDVYYGTILSICEYLKAGITSIQEYYFYEDAILKALDDCSYRATLSLGFLTEKDKTEKYLEKQFCAIEKSPLIRPVCTFHSMYLIDKKQIVDLMNFAHKNGLPVSTHLSETKKENLDSIKEHGKTPTEYLEELKYFDNPSNSYHCVHLSNNDLKIFKKHKASITTCPSSNLKLGSGIPNVFKFLKKGINVAIGTDGPASNNNLDMFKEMFLTATLSKSLSNCKNNISPNEILKMATINGAKAMYYEKIGEIKVGNYADLILIDTNSPHMQPKTNILSNLVYSAKSSDVYLTMINGKILYNKGKFFLPFNVKDIYKKVNAIRKRISI